MARKKVEDGSSEPLPKSKSLTNWRDEMAGAATKAAETEKHTGGGKFFTMRAGQLKFDDVPMPGNQFACIVLDTIFETLYYEGKFDPENMAGPTAYALGRDKDELTWHEDSDPEFAGKLCSESEVCEWGSADTGKGKAAKETRRLAVIPCGVYKSLGKGKGFDLELFDEEDQFKKSDLAFMKLPVTSVKAYSAYVREISEQLGRPLWGVYTNISVEPDDKSQFKVVFELLDEIPDDFMDAVFKRQQEAEKAIDFPYQKYDEDEKQPVAKNNAANKLAGKKAPAKKTARR